MVQERPKHLLEIFRDFVKPGSEADYRSVEEDAARICAELGCPHPHLAIRSRDEGLRGAALLGDAGLGVDTERPRLLEREPDVALPPGQGA
jgi:hypothetical protein